jgi:hypothetical protein
LNYPHAASANCDLLDFGRKNKLHPGRSYGGSIARRILTLWGVEDRGTPLRSMIRRDRIGSDFRLPNEEGESLTPGQALLVRMVAAGPAIHVPETLYLRWQREGGLTDGWRRMPVERVIAGWRSDVSRVFSLIDELVSDPVDREVLKFAQTLYVLKNLGHRCRTEGRHPPRADELDAQAPDLTRTPAGIDRFGAEITQWLQQVQSEVAALQAAPERC